MYNILVADNYDLNWSIYHTINTINVQTLPSVTEINLPVAQPKAMAFCQNLSHSSSSVQITPPR